MRVLVIANNFPWPDHPFDGVFNLRALQALRERGIESRVLRCVPWAPPLQKRWQVYRNVPDRYAVEGIPVRTVRGLMGPSNWGIGTLREQVRARLHAEIRSFKPDVVHVHGLLPAGAIARSSNVPVVLTGHGTETYALPWRRAGLESLARGVIAGVGAVVAVSRFVAGHLERLGAREVEVIYNGADERIFFPRDRERARATLGIPTDAPVVLFVGRFTKEKGIVELGHALESLKDLKPYAVFAGKGELQPWLEQRLNDAGIRYRSYGPLGHEDLSNLYAACDVLALPSYSEGLPTVICEAMNAARVVVASEVGGIPEIVEDGRTGYIVPPRDADALAAKLRAALSDRVRNATMEEAAHARARAALRWSVNAERYDGIYHRLASGALAYGNTM